jgi:hypothetical protein
LVANRSLYLSFSFLHDLGFVLSFSVIFCCSSNNIINNNGVWFLIITTNIIKYYIILHKSCGYCVIYNIAILFIRKTLFPSFLSHTSRLGLQKRYSNRILLVFISLHYIICPCLHYSIYTITIPALIIQCIRELWQVWFLFCYTYLPH